MVPLTVRTLVIALSLFVVVASAFLVKSTIKPFNITSVLNSKDKAFKSYQEHERKYRDEMQVYVLLESEIAWTKRADFFDKLAITTTEFKKIPQLANVSSLFDAEYVVRESDRTFLRTFFEHKRLRDEGLAKLRSESIYQNSFLDKSERATLIALRLRDKTTKPGPSPVIEEITQVLSRLEAKDSSIKGHILGTEVARDAFVTEVIQGQTKLLPLILLLILGLMWLLFRSWRVCFLSFYVMALSYFLTVAFITLCEGSINPFSSFALLFILIISTADLVHLFSALAHRSETDPKERLRKAIEAIRRPCWICAVTTWIGLLSLLAANIPPVRWFGLYCAFGSAVAFFLTFYLLPKLILLFRVDLDLQRPIKKLEGIKIHTWAARFRWPVIIGFLIFSVTSLSLSSQLKPADNLYEKFVQDHKLSIAVAKFQLYFQFAGSIDLVLKTDRSKFWEPAQEEALISLEKAIQEIPGVAHVRGLSGHQKLIRNLFQDKGDIRSYPFKEDAQLRGTMGFAEDFGITSDVMPLGHNEARIIVFLKSLESEEMLFITRELEKLAVKEPYRQFFEVEIGGFSTVRSAILHAIFQGFVWSFTLDVICIFLSFVIFFRSLKWALLAMIPNFIPLLAVGGLMSVSGMSFDINLIVMIALILGIAVDDTTHFLYHLQAGLDREMTMSEAVHYAVKESSVALTSTTAIFVLTLPTFFLTNVLMFNQVAIILILSLILGLAGDMIVLPAILAVKSIQKFLTRKVI